MTNDEVITELKTKVLQQEGQIKHLYQVLDLQSVVNNKVGACLYDLNTRIVKLEQKFATQADLNDKVCSIFGRVADILELKNV